MAEKATLEIRIWTKGKRKLPADLPEALADHVEHVKTLCERGFLAGEIVDDRFDGWWEITRQ